MGISKIMLIALVLCVISALSISCGPESDSAAVTEDQVVTVQRGDLIIDITAVGNLAFSHQEELTFEASGTVGEVLVEIGDSVEEGQVLAKLDDTSIISLQKAVIQARIDLRNAELTGELDVAEVEAAVADARVALETAREALEDTEYTESDIARAELAVINAEIALDRAQEDLERAQEQYVKNRTVPEWAQDYEQKQKEAEDDLVEMLGSVDSLEVELKQSEVASAQAALDEAIKGLGMDTMVAPFTGIITAVNAEAGEAVNASTVVIELVDTDKFEAEILVNEMDILNIRLGTEASVQVDAMPMIALPANVTHISPTATIQSGVVNYKVKVEIQSLQAMMQERQEAMQETMPDISSDELSEQMEKAIDEGRLTQEQAEEMMEQRQQWGVGQQGMPMMLPEDFQLREGLTVTVSILVDERYDVLLVPNSAITSSGRQTYVKVLSSDGTIEERAITTGISNWQYTEVTDGLSEGEKVVIIQKTATPETPASRGGMPFLPGGGRPH